MISDLVAREPEPARRAWLEARVALPTAADGTDATAGEYQLDVENLLRLVSGALRDLHATPVDECPFSCSPDDLLAEADRRVADGSVDPARFDEAYRGLDVDRLLELAHESRPEGAFVPVLVHGDARLTTLRLHGGSVLGWTGMARAGAGDAYRDLATIAADLAARVSPHALGPFFDLYGIDQPDVRRVDFHLLVDQLLR